MNPFEERSTRIYRQKQMFSKEELEERESLCVHEQPAFCAAACPLKLDGRAFAAAIKKGDFTAARALLEKISPFPLILSEGCEAPCAKACRLFELGEGLDIPALERAAMRFGAPKSGRGMFKIKKKKTAAVFGGSLFTLALAGELAIKNYPLHFFVREENAEALLASCAPFLSAEAQKLEAARLAAMDIKVFYGCDIDAAFFAGKRGAYDLVALSGALREEAGLAAPDPLTLCTPDDVLSPGAEEASGVLAALFGAKRAALSADRLAQGMRADNARGEEGAAVSKLYTDLSEVSPSVRVSEPSDGYSKEQAQEESARCIECRCEECIKGCAYLRHYKKFPRILTREIYNNVSIIMGDHMMNKPINSCALCAQCSVLCPNGYDMGEICRRARENMVATDKMPLAAHEFALYDMLFSNTEAFLSRSQPGYARCKYVFFPGCQAGAIAPETVKKSYLDLCARLEGGVALMLGCCGLIAQWAGRNALFEEAQTLLQGELAKLGDPVIIAGCPSCKKSLSETTGKDVLGIWDLLCELGLPEDAQKASGSIAIHDACGARGDEKTQNAIRQLAEALGLSIEETAYSLDKTPCCGYGGLVMYANRELAHEMAADCAAQSEAPFLTYCMACRDRLAREGKSSKHILELIYGAAASQTPDISEKRRNRLALKNELLQSVWEEDVLKEMLDFPLIITEKARKLMDERMILDTDIAEVLKGYRENGEAVMDEETGLLSARRRVGNVTFWVGFKEENGGYIVERAYSHRMTVK